VVDRILFLSPHTDDVEIACGGTVNRFIEQGKKVMFAIFSVAKLSLREKGLNEHTLMRESMCAMNELGVEKYHMFDYPVRRFSDKRQELLDDMIKLASEFNPDLVVVPSSKDTHQDHATIHNESLRAFRNQSLIGYETPQNNMDFPAQMFIRLNKHDVDKKMEAIKCYESQSKRLYIKDDFMRNLAKVRGMQARTEYAEAFEVLRWII